MPSAATHAHPARHSSVAVGLRAEVGDLAGGGSADEGGDRLPGDGVVDHAGVDDGGLHAAVAPQGREAGQPVVERHELLDVVDGGHRAAGYVAQRLSLGRERRSTRVLPSQLA